MTVDATPRASFGHVNIRTEMLEETVSFYERLLGLRRGEAATNPDSSRNLWLYDGSESPSVHVNLKRENDSENALHHIAFNCVNLEQTEARLRSLGVDYQRVETRVAGLVQLNLRDPNDVLVELTFGHERLRQAR